MYYVRPAPTQIDAVIFDCDGLLVDTESGWGRAEAELFAEHGFTFGPKQKAMLVGQTIEGAAAEMAAYFGLLGESRSIAAELLKRVYREVATLAEPLPGAVDLVRACAARLPVAVASNSPRSLLDLALKRSGLAELLPVSVAADEVERPKPDAELYLKACSLLNAHPPRSVAFEDSATGAMSARAAGLYVVAVPSIPGEQLHGDWQLETLADPRLLAWASAVTA
jgi:HAD superfamily hydrolase (TIGR01509 family)